MTRWSYPQELVTQREVEMHSHRSRAVIAVVTAAWCLGAGGAVAQELPKGEPAQGGGGEVGIAGPGEDVTHKPTNAMRTSVAETPAGFDVEFVDKAQQAGRAEVQASQVAVKQSKNPAVKQFAQQMVNDHSKANEALRNLAIKRGVSVPNDAGADPDIEALKQKQGHDFDVAYLALAGPDAHEKAVALFQSEVDKGRDGDLRGFAQKTLPALKHHLGMAREVAAKVAMSK